jgi:TnpA family transposase
VPNDDLATPSERILSPRQRSPTIPLPEDPAEEDLARNWTLSPADRIEALHCRGDDSRRRFAIQLCVLRQYGRFLGEYGAVPVRILNHISRQLRLAPVLSLERPERPATETEQQQRLRDYLRFQTFDEPARIHLEDQLRIQVAQGVLPAQLFQCAVDSLRFSRTILPPPATLERIVSSVAASGRQDILRRIAGRLTPVQRAAIDDLLLVGEGDSRSTLFQLKEYPPEACPAAILTYVERSFLLSSLGVSQIDLSGFSTQLVDHLSQLARKYDAQALKRFASDSRHAMLACFLADAQKTILDHAIGMHDQFLTTLCRRSRNSFEERHRDFRRRAKRGVATLLEAMDILLESKPGGEDAFRNLYRHVEESALRAAMEDCREFKRLEESGYQEELRSRYSHLRRYFPTFLKLPFQGEPGTKELLDGISIAREINEGKMTTLPLDAPVEFVPAAWRAALRNGDGAIDKRLWEISLSLAVRDALRSGDLYLPESRHHVSFSNLIYDEQRWEQDRQGAYEQLSLFHEGDQVVDHLMKEFDEVAGQTERGMSTNPFASIHNEQLKLKRRDALEVPARVKELRRLIDSGLPRVRIEDLLRDVDAWCGFTREFRPLGGYEPRSGNLHGTLLAALIAHGTNLGIAAMGQSAPGITVDMLQHLTRWLLRDETLKAANAALVNYHHQLPLSAVWGQGLISSSDGQRFGIQQSSLLASFYPRYFGYYERAVSVYTHTSDQYSVFGTRVISCSPREALYVLDGLLENNTVLRLREHYTDTHGFTENIFGASFLLGYSFMPRLRDLPDQQLYKLDRQAHYGCLDPLWSGTIDTNLIREQWDQLVRLAASLKNRIAPANVIIQRLANSSPSDRLAKALTALGQVVKTIYILRYLNDEAMRARVQLQLNRGEYRHDLVSRCLFFANRGEFRSGDLDEIMNKASCLSLLSNAVLVWNTVRISEIVEQLRSTGEEILDNDLARVSPLCFAHIIPNGTYNFERDIPGDNPACNTLP